MKLGELFFEQVLIGLLLLLVIALPFAPELMSSARLSDVNTILGLAGGALVLGLAFVLGLVFDRVADSLADRLDTHNRLCYTLRQEKLRQKERRPDPYPEDAYRRATMNVERWINYQRSRIRVARALMVYGPALTMAAVFAAMRIVESDRAALSPRWLLAVPLAYIVAGWAIRRRRELPKTYDDLTDYASRHCRLVWPRRAADTAVPSAARILLGEPLVLSETALLVLALLLAVATACVWPIVMSAAIAGFTVLSAWTWWRISLTYRGYLEKTAQSKASEEPRDSD